MISRRGFLRTAAALPVLSQLARCADTSGFQRVSFRVSASGFARDTQGPLEFTTRFGWDVTLSTAQVNIGPIYLRNAPPSTGTEGVSGRVVAQVLETFTVDALDPSPTQLNMLGSGIDEPARSAEVRFTEAMSGPIADTLGANRAIARVAGTARQGSTMIAFDGALRLPQEMGVSDYQWFVSRRVQNVPADVRTTEGGTLRIRVDPRGWLDFVAFETLLTEGGAVRTFDGRAATVQLRSGIAASSNVYLFGWDPPAD